MKIFDQSISGGLADPSTLQGAILFAVKVPAGFQSGNKLRVRDQGLPVGAFRRGDLRVEIFIQAPARPSKEEELLWRQLASQSTFKARPSPTPGK